MTQHIRAAVNGGRVAAAILDIPTWGKPQLQLYESEKRLRGQHLYRKFLISQVLGKVTFGMSTIHFFQISIKTKNKHLSYVTLSSGQFR